MSDEESTFVLDAATLLNLPVDMIRVWKCPLCGIRSFIGYLAPGSYLVVRCTKSNCAHHQKESGWTATTVLAGMSQPHGKLLMCAADFCLRPWRSFAGVCDEIKPNYADGKPVCGRPWAYGSISKGSRIIVWCKQGTCINHSKGFMICP